MELLLGPLLIDTSCMSHKVEEPDTIAFKNYQKGLGNQFQQLFISEKGNLKLKISIQL